MHRKAGRAASSSPRPPPHDGLAIHPMFATNRQGVHFSLGSTFLFDEMPTFRETLTLPSPAREERLRDPVVRDRMRAELADPARPLVRVLVVGRCASSGCCTRPTSVGSTSRSPTSLEPRTPTLSMPSSICPSTRTSRPSSSLPARPRRNAWTRSRAMIRSPVVMAGSSDGGAHLLSFCGADYTTRLLTEWVPSVLTLEQAVARLTRDTGVGHWNPRSGNARSRHGCRRPGDRPQSPSARVRPGT